MAYLVVLLGSMIVCEALYPGELPRACAELGRAARRRQDHVAAQLTRIECRPTGHDYRWE